MGIRDNSGGGGDRSGGRSGARGNGGKWVIFIVEGDGLVGSVVASVDVRIVCFLYLLFLLFVSVGIFAVIKVSTSNVFLSKKKKQGTWWWGVFLMNLY